MNKFTCSICLEDTFTSLLQLCHQCTKWMCPACFDHFFITLEKDASILDEEPHSASLKKIQHFLQPSCPFDNQHSLVNVLSNLPRKQKDAMQQGMQFQLVRWLMKEGVLPLAAVKTSLFQMRQQLEDMTTSLVSPSTLMLLTQNASDYLAAANQMEKMARLMLETSVFAQDFASTHIFDRQCSRPLCTGSLDALRKCTLCSLQECPTCKLTHDGECIDVHSSELVEKETRPCPECMAPIFKEEGCNDMWCTQCDTGFNWQTGRRILGLFHNPHRDLPTFDTFSEGSWESFVEEAALIRDELSLPSGTSQVQLEMLKRDWIEACARDVRFFHIVRHANKKIDVYMSQEARGVLDRFIRSTMKRQQLASLLHKLITCPLQEREDHFSLLAKASRQGLLIKLTKEKPYPKLAIKRSFDFLSPEWVKRHKA